MSDVALKSGDQREAEAEVEAFKEGLGPFVVAAEATRMAMVFTDATTDGNPIVFANDSFLELTGYDRDEILGQNFDFMVANDTDADAMSRIKAQFRGQSRDAEICCRRKDGQAFWASLTISPVRDDAGRLVQHFASLIDLTRYKTELAKSGELIDELNHRVKNTLSTVQSIVSQAMRDGGDVGAMRDAIMERLFALSRSHDLLTRDNWGSVGLTEVAAEAMKPFATTAGRYSIRGPDVQVPPKAALALGIAFHELATNAVKYGAFSNAGGTIAIEWSVAPSPSGDRLLLCWQERDGPPVVQPTRRGFGSRVIERGLAHELHGVARLHYRPGGLVCEIDVPAAMGVGQ